MPDKKDIEIAKSILPAVAIGTVFIVGIALVGRAFTGRRVYARDGRYLVSVRYPGQRHDLREFVQPSNPDVLAVYSQYGPGHWALYDWVCKSISYRLDFGEFWMTPSETLRGFGDCEDTSILLTSLIRAGGAPDCYVALGSLGNLGHAWVVEGEQIYETTFSSARPVTNPQDYCPYVCFNDAEVLELFPNALETVFSLEHNDERKLAELLAQLA